MNKSLTPTWDSLSYDEQKALWRIMKDWIIDKEHAAEIYITYERNLSATEIVIKRNAFHRVYTRKELTR
jgi:hypothetical protein